MLIVHVTYEIDAEVEGKKIILFEKKVRLKTIYYRTDNTFQPTPLESKDIYYISFPQLTNKSSLLLLITLMTLSVTTTEPIDPVGPLLPSVRE